MTALRITDPRSAPPTGVWPCRCTGSSWQWCALRQIRCESCGIVIIAPPEFFEPDEETLRRMVCARVGHWPVRDSRGAPVADFDVCKRCRKILKSYHREVQP